MHELHHLLTAIRDDGDVAPHGATLEDGYRAAEVCDAIVRSADSGARETVPYRDLMADGSLRGPPRAGHRCRARGSARPWRAPCTPRAPRSCSPTRRASACEALAGELGPRTQAADARRPRRGRGRGGDGRPRRAGQRGRHRLDHERARHLAGGVGERLRGQRARDVPVLQARDPRHDRARGRGDRQHRLGRRARGPAQPRRLLRVEGRGHRPDPRAGHRPRPPGRPRQRRLPGDGRLALGPPPRRRRRRVDRRPARPPADGPPRARPTRSPRPSSTSPPTPRPSSPARGS